MQFQKNQYQTRKVIRMKKFLLFTTILFTTPVFAETPQISQPIALNRVTVQPNKARPQSPLKEVKSLEATPIPIVESKEFSAIEPETSDILKNIDDVLAGKFEKASEYRPPLPLTQKAWSKQETATKSGNKIFVWQRGKTFKVILREGMGTVFKLPDWDSLDQSVLADSVNFRQKEMNNTQMLYVEALSAGADTSLTIIGKSGNIYNFYLASESVLSNNISDQVVYVDAAMPSVKNFFDTEGDLVRKESVENLQKLTSKESGYQTWLNELKFDPIKIRHDLDMKGDKTLAPVLVFRDDRFTYLDYGQDNASKTWPVAYQVVDKVDQPVNVRKSPDGRYMVVETINPITLRYGEKTVCIKQKEKE